MFIMYRCIFNVFCEVLVIAFMFQRSVIYLSTHCEQSSLILINLAFIVSSVLKSFLPLTIRVHVEERPVPDSLKELVATKRHELIETVANVDEQLGEMFLSDQMPTPTELMVRKDMYMYMYAIYE